MKRIFLIGAALGAALAVSVAEPALAVTSGGGAGGGGGGGGGSSSSSSSSSTRSSTSSVPTYEDALGRVEAGRYSAAVRLLNQLVELYPDDADVFNLMGYSLRKMGRYGPAEQYYLRALQLKPHHLGANEYLGELYVETGHLDQAGQRLAVLKSACGNCEEYQELAEAIAAAQ